MESEMLPEDDDAFMRRVMAQYEPELPDRLASRIVAHATAQRQKMGLAGLLARVFGEWDYALNYKGMALAAFAVLGLLGAELSGSAQHGLDIRSVMMADPNWTEEL
jgi:hypothetical protein